MSEQLRGLTVVKCGSDVVAGESGVKQEQLNRYAQMLSVVTTQLIVVSSGAERIGKAEAPHLTDKQILTGLGTAPLVNAWKRAFRLQHVLASQVLATDKEIHDPDEGGVLKAALKKDLAAGVVPIFNQNDKLSIEQPEDKTEDRIIAGENDGIAAYIAKFMGASTLYVITKRNGLFDNEGDPILTVPNEYDAHTDIKNMIADRGPEKQGITAKVTACMWAANRGIEAYIGGADVDMLDVINGNSGTHFVAKHVE